MWQGVFGGITEHRLMYILAGRWFISP